MYGLLLVVVDCMQFVVHWLSIAVCRLFFVVRRLMFVACC